MGQTIFWPCCKQSEALKLYFQERLTQLPSISALHHPLSQPMLKAWWSADQTQLLKWPWAWAEWRAKQLMRGLSCLPTQPAYFLFSSWLLTLSILWWIAAGPTQWVWLAQARAEQLVCMAACGQALHLSQSSGVNEELSLKRCLILPCHGMALLHGLVLWSSTEASVHSTWHLFLPWMSLPLQVLLVRKTQEAGVYHQFGPVEELCPSCSPTQGWQYVMSPGTETGAVFPRMEHAAVRAWTHCTSYFRVEGKLQSFFYFGEDLLACLTPLDAKMFPDVAPWILVRLGYRLLGCMGLTNASSMLDFSFIQPSCYVCNEWMWFFVGDLDSPDILEYIMSRRSVNIALGQIVNVQCDRFTWMQIVSHPCLWLE